MTYDDLDNGPCPFCGNTDPDDHGCLEILEAEEQAPASATGATPLDTHTIALEALGHLAAICDRTEYGIARKVETARQWLHANAASIHTLNKTQPGKDTMNVTDTTEPITYDEVQDLIELVEAFQKRVSQDDNHNVWMCCENLITVVGDMET